VRRWSVPRGWRLPSRPPPQRPRRHRTQ
jgi:hypothetical protein